MWRYLSPISAIVFAWEGGRRVLSFFEREKEGSHFLNMLLTEEEYPILIRSLKQANPVAALGGRG